MEANNVKSMREALETAKKAICNHARASHTCDSLAWENSTVNANCGDILCAHRDLCEAKTAIQKAIAEPPRQCDVGTAEEQYARYCKSLKKGSDRGVLDLQGHYELTARCFAHWAQMSCKESEATDGK